MERDILIALIATFLLIVVGRLIAYGADFLFTKFVCSKCECKSCCEACSDKNIGVDSNAAESHIQKE